MEKNEKELLDELKNFDISSLYQKGSYIDFLFQNYWTQGYILKVRQNNKYDIAFILNQNQMKSVCDIPDHFFGFFGENSFKQEVEYRGTCFNKELYQMQPKQIIQLFNIKLKKYNIQLNSEIKEPKKVMTQKENKKDDKSDDKTENNEKKDNEKDVKEEKNKEIKASENKSNNKNENLNEKNNEDNSNINKNPNINQINKNRNDENEKSKDGKDTSTKGKEKEKEKEREKEKEQEQNKNSGMATSSIMSTEAKTTESSISSDNNNNDSGKELNNNSVNKNNIGPLNNKSLTKLDKNGNPINILGYYTFQFLGGFLIDCFAIINNELSSIEIDQNFKDLFILSLDTIIYVSSFVRKNLKYLKSAMNNRKLTIISQLHAILASFEIILNNFNELYQYDLSQYTEIDEKLKTFANMCYKILVESQEINAIPLKLLIDLIIVISNVNVRGLIINYNESKLYKIFLSHIENLNENELKNINNELMKEYCKYVVSKIFKQPKMINAKICYYSYLINCLKCNKLEKKMNALNDINGIIENFSRFDKIDQTFFDFFIKKNNILNIFFEESVHEEVLKRSNIIFKYLASFNKLNDEILEKLIKEQKNEAMKSILCDVISELPSEKKNLTFNHLIKNLNFDENKSDIEYISHLTEACFNSSNYDEYQKLIEKYTKKEKDKNSDEKEGKNDDDKNEKENKDKEENQNYYGLTLLLNYIIKDFNEKKPYDKNNVNFAIEAFNHIIQFTSNIESKDLYHFMDLLFDNIKSNEKHNSIIQTLILIRKLISKFCEIKNEEEIIKKLDNKYNIISLIVNDLIRYINIIPNEENLVLNNKKIYEGIYPHNINIEERLDFIFVFIKGEYTHYNLKIESNHLEQLYKLFKKKEFKNEMQCLLNTLSRNLKYIENETIKLFYKDILLNPNEFDIINFTDLYTLNIIKDLFFKINHDNNAVIKNGKKIRVMGQNIEGFDLLFEILINNKTNLIQKQISNLLCDLCLYLKDYKSDFHEKYWKFFIDKILKILINLNNENNINGLNGIINLIDTIYTTSCNFKGIIPGKEDTHQVENPFELYQFYCGTKKHKDYKIRVSQKDTIFEMRWKLGYYYDIPVNNVVLMDKKGNKYSFIDDNEIIYDIFPPKIYCIEGKLVQVKVLDNMNILLSIKNNPKVLIEENENIFEILIENLYNEKKLEKDIKQKIYNIVKKMPKKFYINKNIKIFGQKEKIEDNIINKNLNYNNIYILSYFLQCIDYHIKNITEKNGENYDKEKDEFLENFIVIQNGEKLLYDTLLSAEIDYENVCDIQFECIVNIINLLIYINKFKNEKNINKKNYEYIFNNIVLDTLLKKLSEIIISILKIKYEEISEYIYINNNINFKNIIICDTCKLLDTIIYFIDEINSDNKTYYLKYLLINQNIFKEIFLFKYMSCKEDKIIEILHNYFIKNIFEDQNLMEIYLEIMLITDVFKYLIEKDMNGNYFKMLTSIMQKYYLKNKEKNLLNQKESKNNKENNEQNNTKNIKKEDPKSKNEISTNNKAKETIEINNTKEKEKENIDKNEIIENKEDKEKKEENIEVNENKENKEKNIIIEENKDQKDLNPIKEDIKNNKDNEQISDNKNKNENNNLFENKYINSFKTIIDLIIEHINHIYNENSNKGDVLNLSTIKETKNQSKNINNCQEKQIELTKNNKIEGIISFLQSILNLSPEELVPYLLSKIDIIDFFLNKCILSKCNLNPLESKFPLCNYSSSQDSVFQLIIFILRKIPSNTKLYLDIINLLSKYHQIGFWKKNLIKNWELDISEINKQKYIGLKNMASTCYMNAILQQMFMISMLRETILSINNTDKNNVLFQLQLLFSALKVYESQYYDPTSFVLANQLNFYEQMDADEYFGMFIDKIENDIKNLYKDEKENKYKELFRFFFGIKALDELKFVDCGHKRYNEFFYNNIQLEVKGFNNLNNSLKNYFKTEMMDGENKINCEECNIKRTCHKRQIFKSLPNILVVNLKRFEFDYNTMLKSKLNNYFEFPFELDMKEYLIEDHQETNTKYELTGITIHFGFSDYGHYYDLIKSPDGKWYKFNDNCVYEFDEKDIPHEAFGEKENDDDFMKDIEEKDNGQNNAYILMYKKQNFDLDNIENLSKNYNCNLSLPPYNKFSNINNEIKSIINNQMFKFWTIQSIVSPGYQNFVINLLKIDLVQNILSTKSEKYHSDLFKLLRNEGYEIINNKNKKNNTNNNIFIFGLKYFFNVFLRIAIKPKDRMKLPLYIEILKIYIENDLNNAKFILEEFSNTEVINEYLVYCPTKSGVGGTDDIIIFSFKKVFENIISNTNKNNELINNDIDFLFRFINTYVLFISYNINTILIENVNNTFYKIIKISPTFINYLRSKKLEKWVISFFTDDDDEDEDEEMYLNAILSEIEFPKLKCNHKILAEKTMMFDGIKIDDKENENELDGQYANRLKDTSGNLLLIRRLYNDFQKVE